MHTQTERPRIQRIINWMFANPYDPPSTIGQRASDLGDEKSFITSPCLDWLTFSAIAVTLLSSYAIYLYHSSGTGVISEPILRSLASESVAWIPIYRMAMPLLILVMPYSCRRTYSVFFLVLGVLCCANDFPGHYFGIYLIQTSTGLYAGLALCIVLSITMFTADMARSKNRLRTAGQAAGWLFVLLTLQASFYAISVFL